MIPPYALNKTGHDRCRVCDDTGWVELKGTVRAHGVTYSRGSAPCKWCEVGKRRYARMLDLRQRPESNYSIEDVVPMDDGHPVSKEQAKAYIAKIQAEWAKPRPAEKMLRSETPADVERKRKLAQDLSSQFETPEAQAEIAEKKRRAQEALEQGESEPELAPSPAPTQPNFDDVPF